jgi:hypothetical protein
MEIVGVFNERLKNYCYSVNDIRPLHIAQSLACTIHNLEYAIENNDQDWKKELEKDRKELYKEAKEKFGLTMYQVNWFTWYSNMSSLTNFKHSILNSRSVRNNRY